ncbi:palmitoyl-protein thioesterase 1-like [Eupeodes corollae]|uniref:palmitoyl-protein thioesterase 1-like n=1 Tax=Eupeodes corollae TaxID=290404 RepID=UPI00248F6B30|nr:palmitoyl-protein thioesterase 1-like [Eupeodes corollae]XP_055913786.1 palmitoyl-protein thioesterase 1-like [Eupeodes corollae]
MTLIKNILVIIGILPYTWCLSDDGDPTPIVIWHGSGDTSEGIPNSMMKLLENHIDGVYVKRIKIGATPWDEYQNSIFMHPDIQVSLVCNELQNDSKLSNGYNSIGLSQGGVFLRAVAQRCPSPPMKNLITLASPHQGVFGIPKCQSMQLWICDMMRHFLFLAAYKSSTQKFLIPATYWHDPFNEVMYKWHSTFLSDINNEREKKDKYFRNLQKLERFIMVKFRNDSVTQPRETQWFEFYLPGQDRIILPLRESKMYTEDKLGLAEMDKRGQLVFLQLDGEHLKYSDEWFVENIIRYLRS